MTEENKEIVKKVATSAPLNLTPEMDALYSEARILARSTLIPECYRNNPANCLIALDMSRDLDMKPLMLMQSMSAVKGKMCFEGKLLTAMINKSGKYPEGLQYEFGGEGDNRYCICKGKHVSGAEHEYGISVADAKKAGWYDRNPIWRTQTDLMLSYRAATYLVRRYASEILYGMKERNEMVDAYGEGVTRASTALNERLGLKEKENEQSNGSTDAGSSDTEG